MSRQYKALISDFDNTIAGRDHTIPENVVERIKKMDADGYIFTIATGRFYYGAIRSEAQRIGLKHPLITSGGAELIDPLTGSILWGEYIPKSEFEPIIEYFLKKNIFFLLEAGEVLYHPSFEDVSRFEPLSKYASIDKLDAEKATKIVVPAGMSNFQLEQIIEMEEYLTNRFTDLHVAKIVYGTHYGLDITSQRASKHVGVLEWVKHMKMDPEDIVGVGDGYNDYPLLTAVGGKVAMGDAPDELKEIADLVVPTQKESGILTVFDTYFA
jgi:Cof subfamily protein (haloacid dehalogenase superfamily)